jgi:hypothetical protein
MMKVEANYYGGPLHGIVCEMKHLPDYQFFFHEKDRKCYAYQRSELDYTFDEHVSNAATARYDEMRERIIPNDIKPLRDADLD